MASDGQIIAITSHTLGSIGRVVNENRDETDGLTLHQAFETIQQIYDKYILLVKSIPL